LSKEVQTFRRQLQACCYQIRLQ